MVQLVIGAALGFILAQGLLYGMQRLLSWLRREGVGTWIRKLIPVRGSTFVGGFVRYAGLFGAAAALVTLGVWAVADYWAQSARSTATADVFEADVPSDGHRSGDQLAAVPPAPKLEPVTAIATDNPDPYSDSEFKVHRRPHRAGTPLSLKEALLQRSEAKARAELLRETQQHLRRSQYDCEAAERASKYLKSDLDVWGFARWQLKYFPMDSYKGATLPQCQDLKDVVDRSWLNLQSTIAQQSHR